MEKNFINSNLEKKICDFIFFEKILLQNNLSPVVVSFVNPFSYPMIASDNNIIDNVDYWFVDGIALCKLTNLRRKNKISRASFDLSSVAKTFFEFSSSDGGGVALIGATENDIEKASVNLKKIYPSLNVVYHHHGYIKTKFKEIYSAINKSGAKYVIVGMGTPTQEDFSIGCKIECPDVSVIFTCGGFFTQTAMKADYYHPIVKKFGLRWMQRAYLHKHVRERLLKDYPSFILRYLFNR